MGKAKTFEQARVEAVMAGLTNQPITEVYFSRYERNKSLLPKIFYPILDYFKSVDKEQYFFGEQRKSRERHYNYISPALKLYVELFDIPIKTVGFGKTPHAFQVRIYSDNEQKTHDIAVIPTTLFKKRNIIEDSDWPSIEIIFNVKRDDCIHLWKFLLNIS
ncbi:MAG: hypothetical protein ACFE8V_05280 [Promethearchaeota archaeon]